jgi:hypothetical protein
LRAAPCWVPSTRACCGGSTAKGVIHAGSGHIQDPCGFQDGDSDLLPAGTTLHPVGGVPGGQRLGAVLEGRLLIFAIQFPPD